MKTKLIATVLLSVVGLMLVLGGTSYAQSFDNHQPIHQSTISNTVYLPFIAKPPCTFVPQVEMYASVNKPVVKVGEIVTFTGIIVNDCTYMGLPHFYMRAQPSGILLPSSIWIESPTSFLIGWNPTITFTAQAVEIGVVTVTVGTTYIAFDPDDSSHVLFPNVAAPPVVMRVLP
jgi:hypothetical protein